VVLLKYTTIRVSVEDKKKLERIARLIQAKSLVQALRFALEVAEKELGKFKGNIEQVLSSLKYARDVGSTNAEKVDEYLYGGE